MFFNAAFNQPLNNWDMSSAETLENMFSANEVFNQPISGWNVGKVTDMSVSVGLVMSDDKIGCACLKFFLDPMFWHSLCSSVLTPLTNQSAGGRLDKYLTWV